MDLELDGFVAAVTGGGSGIGLAAARLLVDEGGAALLTGREAERLEAAREGFGAGADRVATLALDVTAPVAGEAVLAAAEASFGRLDGLVNAAGSSRVVALEDQDEAEWRAQWELNVEAPRRLTEALAPALAAGGRGAVVNVASSAGRRPSATNAAYAVAKRGQLALTQVQAELLGPRGVRVNAVAPGPTATPLWLDPGGLLDENAERSGQGREEALAAAGERLPLGRLASAAEVAAAVVALLSPGAPNGAVRSVDGGHVPDVL